MTENRGLPVRSAGKTAEEKKQMEQEWEYYNHALVPTIAPHVTPDTSWMKDRRKWRELAGGRYPLFARWITDFDCQEETEWWCLVKDTPFDIMSLKSNRRSLITRGLKRVDVKVIIPEKYAKQMANVLIKAWKSYDEFYEEGEDRKNLEREFSQLTKDHLGNSEYLGAFLKGTDTMIGYSIYNLYDDWVEYSVVKTDPEYLNTQVNAALVYYGLERYMKTGIRYIMGGWRTIVHDTNYQDYLLKNFGYRKAYCKLHIQYRPWVKMIVTALYGFRNVLKSDSKNKLLYMIWCTLRQEEIYRSFRIRDLRDF